MTGDHRHVTPGPDHPIKLEPRSSRVVAHSGSVVIAETSQGQGQVALYVDRTAVVAFPGESA
jgi:hypothetical protein